MRIGLTYDLRSAYLAMGFSELDTAEFDREDTVEAIGSAINGLGHECERIGNAMDLVAALAAGKRWDLVFNIAEGMRGIGREAQVPAILDVYRIPYTFSDPLVMSLTLHKGMTKMVLRDAGIPTGEFLVVENPQEFSVPPFPGPYFVKPVAEGTGKGVDASSIIQDPERVGDALRRLFARFRQPVLLESFLPGREFTVGIVGTGRDAGVIGTLEVVLLESAEKGVYSYINKEECEERVEYLLVDGSEDTVVREAEEVALASWRILGCRDAGRVDIRCDHNGRPVFMEVNPLAGLHPQHSDLPILCAKKGIGYQDLIGMILESALSRMDR